MKVPSVVPPRPLRLPQEDLCVVCHFLFDGKIFFVVPIGQVDSWAMPGSSVLISPYALCALTVLCPAPGWPGKGKIDLSIVLE